jgi:hypothetical protein
MATEHLPAREHSTASLGAVVASVVILVGLVVGASLAISQVVDLAAWAFGRQ